ncbi:major facilitator superfamily transporter [Colletotrichum higginsianum]|uniref:Major facilitator superfamily transporter n=2 Tax=Colletotrichum higginsianum (strain IMI 349063) TaxID=759273 RepID=H1VD72_COLHI|nr:Major facilitator superfamily transporter [Colletotrichum higginsianum IMI 349063]OBR04414.1 Major facilitator superfamily transporter [Colletotrichum higginsianum IMI 349063]CCF38175.1 major facilitator superfamily transporter [Colletotrichum higginsianum]
MSENEKVDVSQASDEAAQPSCHDPDAHLSEDERLEIERKLVRRLDWTLIPWLCVLYLLAFLDRTNIGNAKIAGLNDDLGLSSSQYNSALTIFFVSYAVFEPLTNILLKKLRPSIFIPIIMILWGASMTGMGFVYNWSGLMAARWFLGLTEAGLFPGVNYYLSCWYKRSEFGIRAAIFFSAAAISGSFGGALAAAIEQMAGVGGRPGWAWIFILEGLLTVLFGVASFWMVHDFPDEAKFLSKDDRARVIRRLKMDQQASADHEEFKMTFFWQAVKDWKMWLGMAIYMGCDMPLYAFSLFLPTIVNELGWNTSVVRSQLMTVPPYAVAAVFTVFIGWVADKTQQRGLCNISVSLIGIVGFSMLITTENPQVKYAGTFLGALGIYPCISNTITWVANNVEGVYKRGVVLGFVIGWGNLNGIVSSNIYIREPRFSEGHGVVLAYMSIFLCLGSVLMTLLLRVENQKRRQGNRDHWADNRSVKEIEAMGDRRPDFLYTL